MSGTATSTTGGGPSAPPPPPELAQRLPGDLFDDDDYTYYLDAEPPPGTSAVLKADPGEYVKILESRRFSKNSYSSSYSGSIYAPGKEKIDDPHNDARLLICRCFAGKSFSVTVRRRSNHPPIDAERRGESCAKTWDEGKCGFFKSQKPGAVPFAVKTADLGNMLDKLIFRDAHPTGLVLVTGSTNSGKSELTQSLIYQRVKSQHDQKGRKRWPHVVTFEDPIEQPLFKTAADALANGIEYTPRQKGIDVGRLSEALDDALRQTPSVLFVGEVRSDWEWADLLRFAGTGHLVVATSHAGSLVEAMQRILRGVKAETPSDRGQIAQRVLAVVHQVKFDLNGILKRAGASRVYEGDAPFDVFLPALWRRTHGGVAALVSDGLASVLPNRPGENEKDRTSSFGRGWFPAKLDTKHWDDVILADRVRPEVEQALTPTNDELDNLIGTPAATRDAAVKERVKLLAYAAVRVAGGVAWDQAVLDALDALKVDAKLRRDLKVMLVGVLDSDDVRKAVDEKRELAADAAKAARQYFQSDAVRYDLLGE
jgi:hypothetical protein